MTENLGWKGSGLRCESMPASRGKQNEACIAEQLPHRGFAGLQAARGLGPDFAPLLRGGQIAAGVPYNPVFCRSEGSWPSGRGARTTPFSAAWTTGPSSEPGHASYATFR